MAGCGTTGENTNAGYNQTTYQEYLHVFHSVACGLDSMAGDESESGVCSPE